MEVSGERTRSPVLAAEVEDRRDRSGDDNGREQDGDGKGGGRRARWWCASGRGSRRSCAERSGIIVDRSMDSAFLVALAHSRNYNFQLRSIS
jgi:hypothetical protein